MLLAASSPISLSLSSSPLPPLPFLFAPSSLTLLFAPSSLYPYLFLFAPSASASLACLALFHCTLLPSSKSMHRKGGVADLAFAMGGR